MKTRLYGHLGVKKTYLEGMEGIKVTIKRVEGVVRVEKIFCYQKHQNQESINLETKTVRHNERSYQCIVQAVAECCLDV